MDRPFARIPLGRGRAVELWCEDAVAGLGRRLGRRRADVVVTSPPYNLGAPYRTYSDSRPRAQYLAWVGSVAGAVDGVLARDGSFFLNVGGRPKDPWLPWDVAREVGRVFVLQNVVHWVKSIAIDRGAAGRAAALERDLALGHYKPLVSDRYLHGGHEYVFHFTRRAMSGSTGSRSGSRTRTSRTSGGGGAPESTAVAGAIPGSCRTRRSGSARGTGRIRRRSRPSSPSGACASTALRAFALRSTRSSGSGRPRWPRRGAE